MRFLAQGLPGCGVSDPMIWPRYSYLLAGLIAQARLKIYPDSAHGFLISWRLQAFRPCAGRPPAENLGA